MNVLNVFNTLTLIQIFWKTKTFFKKLDYRFLVETTKIESTSFPFKTTMREANVKTNSMTIDLQNQSITRSGVLPVTALLFWKFVAVLAPLKKKKLDVPTTQMSIFVYFASVGV